MKYSVSVFSSTLLLFSFNIFLLSAEPLISENQPEKGNIITLKFKETDSLFSNPGQGWLNSKRFPCTDRYVRINWADLEPERGKYDWSPFDNVINESSKTGINLSLRIMTCNPHSKGYYASPKWLFDEGCKSFEYLLGGTGDMSGGIRIPRIEPDYSDPVFLQRHAEFIQALAEKYDGNPYIDYIDIGTYGHWGEWHSKNPVSLDVRKKILDIYLDAFHSTQLVFLHGEEELLGYGLSRGVGIRRDGIGSPGDRKDYYSAKYTSIPALADSWKRTPVVYEWYGPYDWMTQKGWPMDSAVNFMLRNHVTFINDNIGKLPDNALPLFNKLSRQAGARFVLDELSHEKVARAGKSTPINMKWSNTGVGKLYLTYILRFYLLGPKNEIVFQSDAKCDPRSWLPGQYQVTETVQLPATIKKGTYKLALAMVDKAGKRQMFRLAIDTPENDGKYILSNIRIK
jgi:hypothetical protein